MNYVKYIKHSCLTGLITLAAIAANAAPLKVGDKAPNFSSKTLSGQPFVLQDYQGKQPVYLKFWATWCAYCVAEMPHLQLLENVYGEQVKIITINVGLNDSIARISELFNQHNYQLDTVFDKSGTVTSLYGVVGTPHHVLIDIKGNIAYRTFLASDTIDTIMQQWSENISTGKGE